MSAQRGVRGRRRSRSANASPIPSTKAGGRPTSGRAINASVDPVFWRKCFIGVLRGSAAAQRRMPNPKMMARWAALVADCSADEERRRRHQLLSGQ